MDEKTSCRDDFSKVAFVGTVLKAGLGVAKKGLGFAVKHPLSVLGTGATVAFNAMDMGSAAATASGRVAKSAIKIPPPPGV